MPKTTRAYYQAVPTGRKAYTTFLGGVNGNSVVIITACEHDSNNPPGEVNHKRFIGSATVTVENIAPFGPPYTSETGVQYVLNVQWTAPLNVAVDITVLDDAPIDLAFPAPPTD